MSEWAITTDQLKELYDQKVQEQQEREQQYFATEFPPELAHLEDEGKLEDRLTNEINEAIIIIENLPFKDRTKQNLTALLLRFRSNINDITQAGGLDVKIKVCGNCISTLDSFYKGTKDVEIKTKVLNLTILFKSIQQYFKNNI